MAIAKPVQDKFTALCKPLDELLQLSGFDSVESMVVDDARLSTHQRGVDTLDVSVEVSEHDRKFKAEVTYFPRGDRTKAQSVGSTSRISLGATLKQVMDEFIKGPTDPYIRKMSLITGLESALKSLDAHYSLAANVPVEPIVVANKIHVAYARVSNADIPVQIEQGATTGGTKHYSNVFLDAVSKAPKTRPYVYLAVPGHIGSRDDAGQIYFEVIADNHGPALKFDIGIASPNRAPRGMDFGKMNLAVKEVIKALGR